MIATRRIFLAARGWQELLCVEAACGTGSCAFSRAAAAVDADASTSGRGLAPVRPSAGRRAPGLPGAASRAWSSFSGTEDAESEARQKRPGAEAEVDEAPPGSLTHFLTGLLEAGQLGVWSSRITAAARRSSIAEFPTIKEEFTWSYLERQGFGDCELDQMVARYPGLLELSVNRNIEPALMFLRSLGICGEALRAVVSSQPGLLALGVEGELEPAVSFLRAAGLSQPEAVELLVAQPWLFEVSLPGLRAYEATLETFGMRWWEAGPLLQALVGAGRRPDDLAALAAYLLHDIGLAEREMQAFGKFQPWLLAMPVEEVHGRVDFLRSQGLSTAEVGALLVATPHSVLRASMQELRARLAVLAPLAKLGKWQTAGALLAAHPQLAEASVSRLQYLHRIFAARGVAGENLIQLLVAQSNPMKWATDLLALQLPSGKVDPAPKTL